MVGNIVMYKLTHNQEYTTEILCGEEYQAKNIYNRGALFWRVLLMLEQIPNEGKSIGTS